MRQQRLCAGRVLDVHCGVFDNYTTHKKLRPTSHGEPGVSRPRSLSRIPGVAEAFLDAPNDRVAHPELSWDFSSKNPFSGPSQSPPRNQRTQSACWRRAYSSPGYRPLNCRSCQTVPESCWGWSVLACASCKSIAATLLRQIKTAKLR